jgi:Arc/MetJ-type ribon-helix-helix transcriptional regulator
LLPIPAKEEFIDELDAGVRSTGYANRSQFIRDAIVEKLDSMGIYVSRELAQPPPRTGKGGRRAQKSKMAKAKKAKAKGKKR